jgi:hypothetical protein
MPSSISFPFGKPRPVNLSSCNGSVAAAHSHGCTAPQAKRKIDSTRGASCQEHSNASLHRDDEASLTLPLMRWPVQKQHAWLAAFLLRHETEGKSNIVQCRCAGSRGDFSEGAASVPFGLRGLPHATPRFQRSDRAGWPAIGTHDRNPDRNLGFRSAASIATFRSLEGLELSKRAACFATGFLKEAKETAEPILARPPHRCRSVCAAYATPGRASSEALGLDGL